MSNIITVHIKNLEKYLPDYKDRILSWFKIYFRDSVDRKTKIRFNNFFNDEVIEKLDEVSRYRFISLIAKECELGRPVPLDEKRINEMGWNTKKCPISLTLRMLSGRIITGDQQCDNVCHIDKDKDKDKDKEEDKEQNFLEFENSVLKKWNEFCDKFPIISKLQEIT
ncbi:MAG: hypothetical protein WC389_20250, partial [Lutibacter sp.]